MEIDYHALAISNAPEGIIPNLTGILEEKKDFLRQHLVMSALTLEYAEWQITMYSVKDYDKVLNLVYGRAAEDNIIPPVSLSLVAQAEKSLGY